MPSNPSIHGAVAAGFEPVRDAFVANFKKGDIGASFCVIRDGETLVDLWGGLADVESERPWEENTLSIMFSATKGLAATALLMLHDRGQLDYSAPVTEYWPEFGRHGKQHLTVRTMLNHRSGVSGLDRPLSLGDLEHQSRMAEAAEDQVPMWTPGSAQGYGAISWGILAGELFRRIAGESLGTFMAREIAEPLDADVHLGLDPRHDSRVATLYPSTRRDLATKIMPRVFLSPKVEGRVYRSVLFGGKSGATRRALGNPKELGLKGMQNYNSPRVRRMELPWCNGFGNARGLARAYAPLANGGMGNGKRLFSASAARLPQVRMSFERDRVMCRDMGFSLGFLKENTHVFGPNPNAFGHPGAGGGLGWCDPDLGMSIGFVMNKMDFHIRSPRAIQLCRALYQCV